MANTYYDSQLTAAEIEAALEAIDDVIVPANNGKVLAINNGKIEARSVQWGGGEPVLEPLSVTANGDYTPGAGVDGFDEVHVSVPNSYTASDEGKVVSNGALVAQTARSSQITQNGTYDTTLNNEVTVNISGGGSAVVQPLSVTQNGTYNPPSGVDGYAPVTVNVSGGGGATILNGKSDPTSSIGSDGNIYLKCVDGSDVFGTPSSNTPDGANISATSVYSSYAAYKAFGNQDGWGSNGGQGTLSFTFDSDQYKINQLQFVDYFTVSGGYLQAKNFSFEGSNDGTNWEVLYSQSNAETSSDIKTVTINTNNYYRYFRFVLNSGGGYCGLRSIIAVGEKYGIPVNSTTIVNAFLKVNGAWQNLIGSDISDVGGL